MTIAGRSVGVFNVGGRFYALRNVCPHQGGPLCDGPRLVWLESPRPGEYVHDESRPLLQCPWHGWEFEMATGRSWFDPESTRVRAFPVSVEPGEGSSERRPGPYTAETYPVSIEDDFNVVVEVS